MDLYGGGVRDFGPVEQIGPDWLPFPCLHVERKGRLRIMIWLMSERIVPDRQIDEAMEKASDTFYPGWRDEKRGDGDG